ncbi:FtsB family cell division protein [Desulfurobacterium sp.]
MIQKKLSKLLIVGWVIFLPFYLYSYFFGENSLKTLKELQENYQRLQMEKKYWNTKVEILNERIKAIEKNQKFYYKKLAREMLVKGKKGEEIFLFVTKKHPKIQILNKNSTKTEE